MEKTECWLVIEASQDFLLSCVLAFTGFFSSLFFVPCSFSSSATVGERDSPELRSLTYYSIVKLSPGFGGAATKKMLTLLCPSTPKEFHG